MSDGVEQIEISRLIRAPRPRVYDAWTDPSQIVLWWGAGPVRCTDAEMDVRVGGSYRVANQTPDGATMWISGTFEHVDPPTLLRYTWAVEPVDATTAYSVVDVAFAEEEDGTRVTVTHSRIATVGDRATNMMGWTGCLDGLKGLLEGSSG